MNEFFDFAGDKFTMADAGLKCSESMIEAINKIEDCKFIELLTKKQDDKRFDIVICDISSDEIPSRNIFSIQYTERIAFVFGEKNHIPTTCALRKDFPETMHQNSVQNGYPRELCLYEENESVTLVNWTPERHVNRVKWWLVSASKGKLHADDQSVEPLFFKPSIIIAIPSDLSHGIEKGKKLSVTTPFANEGESNGLFLDAKWSDAQSKDAIGTSLLEILVPKITHGRIYSPPEQFSKLTTVLNSIGINAVKLIRSRLQKFNKENKGQTDGTITVIVFVFPIRRTDLSDPEQDQTVGFMCKKSIKELSLVFQVILKESFYLNQDFDGALHPVSGSIADFPILPVEVLVKPDAQMRRLRSGYKDTLTKGILIGAGALGGSLLDIWIKGGWGEWAVIDNDSFRPHNFIRHVSSSQYLGNSKAHVAAFVSNENFEDANVKSIHADACDWDNKDIKSLFSEADLAIDASASFEYPRECSEKTHAPRHISVFFSPSGNDAVLLAENAKRKIRLSALEAQYYRALIENSVGDCHLVDAGRNFRSGVSCRDISGVLSHSRCLSLSSLLADQIRFASEEPEAAIRIWSNNVKTGCRQLTEIEPKKIKKNKYHNNHKFRVFWDEGIEEKVQCLREKNLPNETGGILVGYHDMLRKTVYIVDALPQPTDSVGTPFSFIRGTTDVVAKLQRISTRTAGNVGYIGEWHSHPNGSSANMSSLDQTQLAEIAEKLSYDGLPAYQMIVAKNEVKVYEKKN